jgi:gluconate 2-dehydrogenase gamma chain
MSSAIQVTRRKFLLSALIGLPALGIAVHKLNAPEAAALAAPDLHQYMPEFFSACEWDFILAACDRLIPPEGRGPGALETNVPIFLDQQLHGDFGHEIYLQGPFDPRAAAELGYQLPYTPQQIFQLGIKASNELCILKHGKAFHELDVVDQTATLKALQSDKADFSTVGETVLTSGQFFAEMLANTKSGYLADPIYGGNKGMKAWIAIGFPGARASYL